MTHFTPLTSLTLPDYSVTPWTLEGADSPQAVCDSSPAAVAMSGGNRKRILKYIIHLKPSIGPRTCNSVGESLVLVG